MLLLKVAFEIFFKKGNIFKRFQTNKITTFLIGGISFRQIRKDLSWLSPTLTTDLSCRSKSSQIQSRKAG